MTSISNDDIRRETIASYAEHTDEYLHKKDVVDTERTQAYWEGVEFFLSQLDAGETIFEIGSGSGYDAARIEEAGFSVMRSDASEAFISILGRSGVEAVHYDVLDGPTPERHKAIYANAVLLHFNKELFDRAVANIVDSFAPDGYLCLGMKVGDFEGWRYKGLSGRRYFKFWTQDDLRDELQQNGFTALNETLSNDGGFVVVTATRDANYALEQARQK